MHKLIYFFILSVICFTISISQVNNFSLPVANSDNVFSLFSNPAGLGTDREFQMLYSRGYTDKKFIDDMVEERINKVLEHGTIIKNGKIIDERIVEFQER